MTQPAADASRPGDPYCSACGYLLRGSTESGRCPECGKPLVETLQRYGPHSVVGIRSIRRRSEATVFGLPVWEIALGPDPIKGERRGRARALIAVGDVAIGGIAVGGMSVGVVAFGGLSVGVAALGGMAVGAATAAGGTCLGGIALGGVAAGGLCTAGVAAGIVAQGPVAAGVYARGNVAVGPHTITPGGTPDPAAVRVFDAVEPIMGATTPAGIGLMNIPRPLGVVLAIDLVLASIIGLMALTLASRTERGVMGKKA